METFGIVKTRLALLPHTEMYEKMMLAVIVCGQSNETVQEILFTHILILSPYQFNWCLRILILFQNM